MLSSEPGFGIYVHWPFCLAKCPYCDFNSHVRHGGVDADAFALALALELAWFADQAPGREVTSIFFGGGTPSLMPPAAVGRVIEAIARSWSTAPDLEVTLEANPTSVEAENFAGYRTAGVNRVSVGVQALNDTDLAALGRRHSADEALTAFRLAARIFPRVSFDLIYARPGQSAAAWTAELERALGEQQGHMSLYPLTIEPGTRFADLNESGRLLVPDEEDAARLFDITQELTAKAGLSAYEVSNHAAPGHESRHNLLYWRYGEYVGVGPGAHSRIVAAGGRRAIVMEANPERWRSRVLEQGAGIVQDTPVSAEEQASEYLLMGLRVAEGISLSRHAGFAGRSFDERKLARLGELGLIEQMGDRLAATPAGRRVLNALIGELVT
jgi:putative oxygen-independent coproporphyrinogen III oxidase